MVGGEKVDQDKTVHRILFSPDGTLALIVGIYPSYVWDFTRQRLLAKVEEYVTGAEKAVLLPDKSAFVTGGYDPPYLKVWAVSDGRLLATIPTQGEVASIGVTKDGKWVATGTENSVAEVWDLGWLPFVPDAKALRRHACEVGLASVILLR
jgi:WD40 repeat protein